MDSGFGDQQLHESHLSPDQRSRSCRSSGTAALYLQGQAYSSGTGSESSLASGLSDSMYVNNTATAATGNFEARFRQGYCNLRCCGINYQPGSGHSDEDVAVEEIWIMGSNSPTQNTSSYNNGRFGLLPSMSGTAEAASNNFEESPFFSISHIEASNPVPLVCPNCRAQISQINECACVSALTNGISNSSNGDCISSWGCSRFGNPDSQRTPTKLRLNATPSHCAFPVLASSAQCILPQRTSSAASSSQTVVTGDYVGGEGLTTAAPPSPPLLELTGDVRAVNFPALDHRPIRT
ncbi:unnamed protein product [Dicrocoelium dendriticum]|nr:unnamed protein product [Dicrocoelium dendriticum]